MQNAPNSILGSRCEASRSSGLDLQDVSEPQGLATPCFKADVELDASSFTHDAARVLFNLLNQAVEAPCCNHSFCSACIWHWLYGAATCPFCRTPLQTSQLTAPHPFTTKALAASTVHCDFYISKYHGCSATVKLHGLQAHVKECPFNPTVEALMFLCLLLSVHHSLSRMYWMLQHLTFEEIVVANC